MGLTSSWIPAFAGMTVINGCCGVIVGWAQKTCPPYILAQGITKRSTNRHSGGGRDPVGLTSSWIPAFAGMTVINGCCGVIVGWACFLPTRYRAVTVWAQKTCPPYILAQGITKRSTSRHSGGGRDPVGLTSSWIPAFAGMTVINGCCGVIVGWACFLPTRYRAVTVWAQKTCPPYILAQGITKRSTSRHSGGGRDPVGLTSPWILAFAGMTVINGCCEREWVIYATHPPHPPYFATTSPRSSAPRHRARG